MGRGQKGSDGHDKVGLGSIRRPVIGLALGGGAARGFAHIGIVRTLVAHGIVPNVVVGTSIGAVVGGAYAAGHLDTLEEWARSLGAEIVIAANLSSDVFAHGTTIHSHGPSGEVTVAMAPDPVVEPPPPKRGFGKFFSPERTMKREFFGSGGRPGISSVMVDAFNIMQDRITRARLAGDPPDLLISPRVGEIGWFDFHRADDLIAYGARAAERAIVSIQEAIHILAPGSVEPPPPVVDKVP